MLEKFDRAGKDKVYFGKAGAEEVLNQLEQNEEALKRVIVQFEKLERSKRSLRDR